MKILSYYIGICLVFCVAASVSCRKFIEKQKQQVAENIITDGNWRVSRYVSGDSDLTAAFNGYLFQFKDNGTVDGIMGSQIITGTWSADIASRTISSGFPAGKLPVSLLNYTWKITDSYNDSVSANTQVDTTLLRLELHKN